MTTQPQPTALEQLEPVDLVDILAADLAAGMVRVLEVEQMAVSMSTLEASAVELVTLRRVVESVELRTWCGEPTVRVRERSATGRGSARSSFLHPSAVVRVERSSLGAVQP